MKVDLSICCLVCAALVGCAESSESPEVLVERGHLMEGQGRFDEALDAYTKALKGRPNDPRIYYDRGVAFGRSNRWQEAVDDYTRAIEHDPSLGRAYNNRAAAYGQLHQYDRAVADFTQAIRLDPKSELAYRNRGLAYHDLGQLSQAIDDYTVAIGLDPTPFEGHFERANAYLDLGEFAKAVADYDRALKIDPARAAAWLNRSEAYRRLGDNQRARDDLARAKQLDPTIVATNGASAPPPKRSSAPESRPIEAKRGEPRALQENATQPDAAARRARAIAVAKEFLEGKGFQIETGSVASPFDLTCVNGSRRYRVEVQLRLDANSALRFTREQIEAASHGKEPIALLVVGNVAPPVSPRLPYTGGTVVQFVENWKPVREKLVPVVYEYSVP